MPASPMRSSVRASAAKSFPVIERTSVISASIAGVATPAGGTQCTHRHQADRHVLGDVFMVERLWRSCRLIRSVAVGRKKLAGLDQCRAAHAVDTLEPVLQRRHRRAQRCRNRHAFGIDRFVQARDRRRHALGVEPVALAAIDLARIGDAVRDMQHRIGIGEACMHDGRRGDCVWEQRRKTEEHRIRATAGKRGDLQPALLHDRTYPRRAEPPAGIRIVVHLGDIDSRAAVGRVQRAPDSQRSAGVALDQQDHLSVAQHRCERPRHRRLRIAARHDDDHIAAVHGGAQVRRCMLDRGKPIGVAFDLNAATVANHRQAACRRGRAAAICARRYPVRQPDKRRRCPRR